MAVFYGGYRQCEIKYFILKRCIVSSGSLKFLDYIQCPILAILYLNNVKSQLEPVAVRTKKVQVPFKWADIHSMVRWLASVYQSTSTY